MFKIIAAMIIAFMLTGCFGTTKPLQVKDTEVRYEKIPKSLTEPCVPEVPKVKEEYMKLKPHERESYLAEYSVSVLGTVKDCNIKLKKIDKLNGQLK